MIPFVLDNQLTLRQILKHIQNKTNYFQLWWREKGMAKLLRNVQSKSADFCRFNRHNELIATTMQRNQSAHTVKAKPILKLICFKRLLFSVSSTFTPVCFSLIGSLVKFSLRLIQLENKSPVLNTTCPFRHCFL